MFASLIGSTIFLATSTVSFLVPTAFASSTTVEQPPTLHQLAETIAIEHGIPKEWMLNLIDSESDWDPSAIGDNGCSYGLAQINICAHKGVTKAQAKDPAYSLNWTADRLKEGNGWWWTSGNCYSFVLTKIPDLPHMADIQPNSSAKAGSVAIFYYTDKNTGKRVKHIAYVLGTKGGVTIQGANRIAFVIETITIPMSDPHLVGFWSPEGV